jgi:hypothetical protein
VTHPESPAQDFTKPIEFKLVPFQETELRCASALERIATAPEQIVGFTKDK